MNVKKKNALFGRYPSCDLLNNALRFLRDGNTDEAIKVVYVVTVTDAMDYERGNFGETVKVFSKRSDAVKWIKEQRAEQKGWPKPIRDVFTYKKFEVV